MPVPSQLSISNDALDRINAANIASLVEDSLEASKCRAHYPRAVSKMLDGEHDWSFANRRVRLAALVNDRDQEWLYAYALPSNMGSAVRVLPDLAAAGIAVPVPLPGEPYAESWTVTGGYIETPYIIEGSTLYSNVQSAIFEYTINDITGLSVSGLVIDALTLELASRICVPVKKDSEREARLLQAAEIAWQRAIADDRNRQPETQDQYISETIAARRGYLTEAP